MEIVTFETAKLAKEKGFNWKVRYSFGHPINPHLPYPNFDFGIPVDFNSPNLGRNWETLYSGPRQDYLQKWLREKHGIHVWANISSESEYEEYEHTIIVITNDKPIIMYSFLGNGWSYIGTFKTNELALENGLEKALKLIEL